MHLSANAVEHIFLISCVLYILCESFACARQIIAAERGIGRVPEGFSARLTLAAHRKAAAYTAEAAQARLASAFVKTAFAVAMTAGHGLTLITAFLVTLTDNALLAQWALIVIVLALLLAVELPISWLIDFRLKERFGYQRQKRGDWMKNRGGVSLAGLAIAVPVTAALLILFELCGSFWWLALWACWAARLIWLWKLSLMRGMSWSRVSRPIENESLRRRVRALMAEEGFELEDIVLMTRPAVWKHAHVLIPGQGRKRTIVVFAHSAARLTVDELLAVIAGQLARVKNHHAPWRAAFSAIGALLLCAAAGWGAATPEFFSGLGFSTLLTSSQPGTRAGFALAAALVTFPIVFFPVRMLYNYASRQLRYAADRDAADRMGGDALIRALAKLHRDYSASLTPSRFYSLMHYTRPHAGMRAAHILRIMRARGIEPLPPSAVRQGEPSVLAAEKAHVQSMEDRRENFARARRAAEEQLLSALMSEETLLEDDGFGEGDAAAEPAASEAAAPAERAARGADSADSAEEKHSEAAKNG